MYSLRKKLIVLFLHSGNKYKQFWFVNPILSAEEYMFSFFSSIVEDGLENKRKINVDFIKL